MEAEELKEWFENSKPGDSLAYHKGRALYVSGKRANVYSTATYLARALYNEGHILLTQRRLSTGRKSEFEWLATRRERRETPKPHWARDTFIPIHLFTDLRPKSK